MPRVLVLLAKVAVSAGLLALAFDSIRFPDVLARLEGLDRRWAAAALAVLGAQIALLAVRWQAVLRAMGGWRRLGRLLRFAAIAQFFNQLLPATLGGDAMRAWLLQRGGESWRKAVFSVLVDRLAGLLALILLMLLVLPGAIDSLARQSALPILVAMALAGLGGIVALLAAPASLRQWLARHRWGAPVPAFIAVARRVILRRDPGAGVLGVSLVIHLGTVTAAWCIAMGLAARVDFLHLLFLMPAVTIAAMIPVSVGGWGVREGAMVTAFALAGLSAADGLAIALVLGLGQAAIGVPGGVLWLVQRRPAPLASPPVARAS